MKYERPVMIVNDQQLKMAALVKLPPFHGKDTRVLMHLTGIAKEPELRDTFDLVNLFDERQKPWSTRKARERAGELAAASACELIVCYGMRTGQAFGVTKQIQPSPVLTDRRLCFCLIKRVVWSGGYRAMMGIAKKVALGTPVSSLICLEHGAIDYTCGCTVIS